MDPVFLQAALIRPPTILGWTLRPFSAGHALILQAIDCAFMLDGVPPTPSDLAKALYFCSKSVEDAQDALYDDDIQQQFTRIGRRIGWKRMLSPVGTINDAIADVEEYIRSYLDTPEHRVDAGGITAPALWAIPVGVVVASKGAVGLSEAWNMGISVAACFSSTAGDLQGADSLLSYDMRRDLEKMRAGGECRTEVPDDQLTDQQRKMQDTLDARRRKRQEAMQDG